MTHETCVVEKLRVSHVVAVLQQIAQQKPE